MNRFRGSEVQSSPESDRTTYALSHLFDVLYVRYNWLSYLVLISYNNIIYTLLSFFWTLCKTELYNAICFTAWWWQITS